MRKLFCGLHISGRHGCSPSRGSQNDASMFHSWAPARAPHVPNEFKVFGEKWKNKHTTTPTNSMATTMAGTSVTMTSPTSTIVYSCYNGWGVRRASSPSCAAGAGVDPRIAAQHLAAATVAGSGVYPPMTLGGGPPPPTTATGHMPRATVATVRFRGVR